MRPAIDVLAHRLLHRRSLGSGRPNRIFLHVGLPKTATSSLQRWFRDHRDELVRSGISYPDHFGPSDDKHSFLVTELLVRTSPTSVELDLIREPVGSILYSSEGLSNHLYDFDPEALSAFRTATDGIHIVLLLATRQPEDWLRSYYRQCVLNPRWTEFDLWGTDLTLDEVRTHPRIRALLNYEQLRADLAKAFGARSIIDIDFDQPDWFPDLLDKLGLAHLKTQPLPFVNDAIPTWAVETMRQVNHLVPSSDGRIGWKQVLQEFLSSSNTILAESVANFPPRSITPDVLDRISLPEGSSASELSAFADFVRVRS